MNRKVVTLIILFLLGILIYYFSRTKSNTSMDMKTRTYINNEIKTVDNDDQVINNERFFIQ